MTQVLLVMMFGGSVLMHAGAQAPVSPVVPDLVPPAGASVASGGGYGLRQPVGRVVGRHYRLTTSAGLPALTDHYAPQLISRGWKQAFRQAESGLSLVRFTWGADSDPWTGTLFIIPFAATKQAVVSFRAVRSRARWPEESGRKDVAELFSGLTTPLIVPSAIVKFDNPSGGGSNDYSYGQVRLETKASTPTLMSDLQKQVVTPSWAIDGRLGDDVQTVVRRSSVPGGHAVEVWILTTMPGVAEVDGILTTMCSARTPPTARGPGRLPGPAQCSEGR